MGVVVCNAVVERGLSSALLYLVTVWRRSALGLLLLRHAPFDRPLADALPGFNAFANGTYV